MKRRSIERPKEWWILPDDIHDINDEIWDHDPRDNRYIHVVEYSAVQILKDAVEEAVEQALNPSGSAND